MSEGLWKWVVEIVKGQGKILHAEALKLYEIKLSNFLYL